MHPASCHRLLKDCQTATFARRRATKKPAAARKSQLEDKLDSLVSLLQAQHAPNPNAAPTPAATTESSTPGLAFQSKRQPQPLPYTDESGVPTPQPNAEPSQLRSVRSPGLSCAAIASSVASASPRPPWMSFADILRECLGRLDPLDLPDTLCRIFSLTPYSARDYRRAIPTGASVHLESHLRSLRGASCPSNRIGYSIHPGGHETCSRTR